ncbi:MAG: putative rane protein [Bryobacterales bacterium]|nr:putative rane protein [Bryobacterales bacterium]
MSVLEFAQWIQNTEWATTIRMSAYLYPTILSTHLTGIALFGGAILITDLRLLGAIMRNQPVSDVVNQLRVPKRIGFLIVATCGFLLASSKAEEYYYNAFFRTKLTLLVLVAVHALVFRSGVYNNTAALDQAKRMPGKATLAAALSLVLWISIACAGRGIGYIEPPLDKLHALLRR